MYELSEELDLLKPRAEIRLSHSLHSSEIFPTFTRFLDCYRHERAVYVSLRQLVYDKTLFFL